MRIDIASSDIHYDVLLDGEPVPRCVMADEERGVVEVIDLDPAGKTIPYPEGPRGFQTRMRWGKVECCFREPAYRRGKIALPAGQWRDALLDTVTGKVVMVGLEGIP